MIPTLQRRRVWLRNFGVRISKENMKALESTSKPINCNSKTTKEECSSLITDPDWLFISGKLFSESVIPEHQVPLPQESLRFKSLGLFQVYQAPWQWWRPTWPHLPLQPAILPLRAYAASTWRLKGLWNVVCVFPSPYLFFSPYLLLLKFILPRTISVNSLPSLHLQSSSASEGLGLNSVPISIPTYFSSSVSSLHCGHVIPGIQGQNSRYFWFHIQ